MIKDACTIVIQRCSNGYIVNEMKLASDGKTFFGETLVFNEIGPHVPEKGLSLFRFLQRHFDITSVSAKVNNHDG